MKRFAIEDRVRWSDIDAAGVIFYGAYVRFFEIAESELFRAAGMSLGDLYNSFDCWLPRVRYSCEFRAPARLDDVLRISAWFKRLGARSMTLGFEVEKQDGVRVADCEIVLACVSRATFRAMPLPDALRAALAPFSD
ncbi:MAG TPA: thioesterase family protein [Candidatus Eremiobacteraceae bacterium]|nr:thioesterase family protein [Candidatus Eremiobacteraceae bacterium]